MASPQVINQEADVADKKLVGNGGMMWLPKMDVVSVQIPQPQFESTRRGRRGDDMPRYKGQVRDLENFENFPGGSGNISVLSKERKQYDGSQVPGYGYFASRVKCWDDSLGQEKMSQGILVLGRGKRR